MKTALTSCFLCLLVGLIVALSLSLGAVKLSVEQVISGFTSSSEFYFTIHEYRLPRTILAILVGGMMALSGALVQGVIRNPLASPDVLGISQGAGLAAVLLMTVFPSISISWLPWAALSGGFLSALLLWCLCGSHSNAIKLALTGIAMAALYSSAVDFLMLTRPLEINNALLWLTGSLWGRSWDQITMLLPWVILVPLGFALSKKLNLISLGDDAATSLGQSIPKTRLLALAAAVGLTASCVSICGPIGFLGLIAPHIARRLVGGQHQLLLPCAMLVGMIILLLADLMARIINPPIELSAGIMTAIIGAPYFLWLLVKIK